MLPTARIQQRENRPLWIGGGSQKGLWITSQGYRGVSSGNIKFRLRQFLDVHVLVGDDAHRAHETRRTVDVPHPRIAQRQFEEDVTADRAGLHINVIAQLETPLSLHNVLEQPNDVAVLLKEFQLQIVFVTFDFFAHATIMPGRAPRWATPPRRALLCGLRRHLP